MLLIHFFNMTHFKNSSDVFIELEYILYAETLLYIIDTLNIGFYTWVLFSAAQFHFNFNLVTGSLHVIHLVDNLAILAMRFHWILGFQEGVDPLSSVIFRCLMTCSIYCIVAAMCSLPCSVLERCFATLYLKDYETRKRKHISYLLVLLLNVIGAMGAVALQNKDNTIYIVVGLIVPNCLAVTVNVFLKVWNKRKNNEYKSLNARYQGQYTLAERFQIVENIKSLKMIYALVFYMGFMNVVLIACVLVSSFHVSPDRQAICSMLLDGSIFLYSFMLPQITTYYCKRWQEKVAGFKERIGCWKKLPTDVNPMEDQEAKSRTMMNAYFDQLQSSWEK